MNEIMVPNTIICTLIVGYFSKYLIVPDCLKIKINLNIIYISGNQPLSVIYIRKLTFLKILFDTLK